MTLTILGHPALDLEILLHNFPSISKILPKLRNSDDDDDTSEVHYTINLATTSTEDAGKIAILSKCIRHSCFVDMIKLPEIFLEHPHVRVYETNNEMTIRTMKDEFIARKIIYD